MSPTDNPLDRKAINEFLRRPGVVEDDQFLQQLNAQFDEGREARRARLRANREAMAQAQAPRQQVVGRAATNVDAPTATGRARGMGGRGLAQLQRELVNPVTPNVGGAAERIPRLPAPSGPASLPPPSGPSYNPMPGYNPISGPAVNNSLGYPTGARINMPPPGNSFAGPPTGPARLGPPSGPARLGPPSGPARLGPPTGPAQLGPPTGPMRPTPGGFGPPSGPARLGPPTGPATAMPAPGAGAGVPGTGGGAGGGAGGGTTATNTAANAGRFGRAAPWLRGGGYALGGYMGGQFAGGLIDQLDLGGEASALDRGLTGAAKWGGAGAGIGASAGLLGGPFAPITSGMGALIGGGIGAVGGGIASVLFGDGRTSKEKMQEGIGELRGEIASIGNMYGLDSDALSDIMLQYDAATRMFLSQGDSQGLKNFTNQLAQNLPTLMTQAKQESDYNRQQEERYQRMIDTQAQFAPMFEQSLAYSRMANDQMLAQAGTTADSIRENFPHLADLMEHHASLTHSASADLYTAYAAQMARGPERAANTEDLMERMRQEEILRQATAQGFSR